jgi:hypothetical protein
MNPLKWKREHQVALFCAVVLGCLAGLILGLREIKPYGHGRWIELYCSFGSCTYLLDGYWLLVILWAGLGGIIGATVVYIRQLLRA